MILTDVGEIGVYYEGREMILRPSLYAMSKLGDKKEILEISLRVMAGDLAYSLAVIQCCADDDTRDIFGYIDENLRFNEMFASVGEIIIVAQSLMKHGIIGDIERDEYEGEASNEFDAKSYVSLAVAHLGMSEREAWQMTMTSLAGALMAKFPPEPRKYLTEKEENEMLAWFEKIKDKR